LILVGLNRLSKNEMPVGSVESERAHRNRQTIKIYEAISPY
jgi:hypothetical protein